MLAKRIIKTAIGFLIPSALVLGFGILVVNAQTWTAPNPGTTPPNNNVAAPINTGLIGQVKSGPLGVKALNVFGGILMVKNSNRDSNDNPTEGGEIRLFDLNSDTNYWTLDNYQNSFRLWRWTGSAIVPFQINPQGVLRLPLLGSQTATAPGATDGVVGVRADGTLFKTTGGAGTGSGLPNGTEEGQTLRWDPVNNWVPTSIFRVRVAGSSSAINISNNAVPEQVGGSARILGINPADDRLVKSNITFQNLIDIVNNGGILPAGGTTGQVLAKNSNTNYDVGWVNQSSGGGGTTDSRWVGDNNQSGVISRSGGVGIGFSNATSANVFLPLRIARDNNSASLWADGTAVFGNIVQVASNLNVGNLGEAISNSRLTVQGGNIHIHHNGVGGVPHVYTRFTNSATGSGLTDGTMIGIDSLNNATFYNYENTGMYFGTNMLPRLYIHNDGNVGIGTGFGVPTNTGLGNGQNGRGNPTANLHVAGTVRLQGIPALPTGTSAEVVRIDAQGNLSRSPGGTGLPNGTETDLTLRWDGQNWVATNILKVGPDANGGIRVGNPTSVIPVQEDGNSMVLGLNALTGRIIRSSVTLADLTNIKTVINNIDNRINTAVTNIFNTHNGVWAVSGNNISNKNSGNVGIGTSSPVSKLHVNGTGLLARFGSVDNNSITLGTNDPSYGAWFRNDGSNTVLSTHVGSLFIGFGGNSGKTVHIGNVNPGVVQITANAPAGSLVIPTNGNVGIGKNNPTAKLDVNGSLWVKGASVVESGVFSVQSSQTNEGGEIRLVDSGSSSTENYWSIDNGPSNVFRIFKGSNVPIKINPNNGNVGIGLSSNQNPAYTNSNDKTKLQVGQLGPAGQITISKHTAYIGGQFNANISDGGASVLRVERSTSNGSVGSVVDFGQDKASLVIGDYGSGIGSNLGYAVFINGGKGFVAGNQAAFNTSNWAPIGPGSGFTGWNQDFVPSYGYFGVRTVDSTSTVNGITANRSNYLTALIGEHSGPGGSGSGINSGHRVGSLGTDIAALKGEAVGQGHSAIFRNEGNATGVCIYTGIGNEYTNDCANTPQGGLKAEGQIVSQGNILGSSLKTKENIKNLSVDINKVLSLSPKSFTYRTTGLKSIGYIAEEVSELGLTDLVSYDEKGDPAGIYYDKISVYLLEVVKEQQKEIKDLRKEVEEIKKLLNK